MKKRITITAQEGGEALVAVSGYWTGAELRRAGISATRGVLRKEIRAERRRATPATASIMEASLIGVQEESNEKEPLNGVE